MRGLVGPNLNTCSLPASCSMVVAARASRPCHRQALLLPAAVLTPATHALLQAGASEGAGKTASLPPRGKGTNGRGAKGPGPGPGSALNDVPDLAPIVSRSDEQGGALQKRGISVKPGDEVWSGAVCRLMRAVCWLGHFVG